MGAPQPSKRIGDRAPHRCGPKTLHLTKSSGQERPQVAGALDIRKRDFAQCLMFLWPAAGDAAAKKPVSNLPNRVSGLNCSGFRVWVLRVQENFGIWEGSFGERRVKAEGGRRERGVGREFGLLLSWAGGERRGEGRGRVYFRGSFGGNAGPDGINISTTRKK